MEYNTVFLLVDIMVSLLVILFIILIISLVRRFSRKSKERILSNNNYSADAKQVVRDYKIDSWSEFIRIIIISGICGFIGLFFSLISGENPLICFYGGAAFPWGYSVISKIIDDWVEFYAILRSGVLWCIIWLIKIALSVMLGFVIMPIKLITSIYNIINSHKLDKEVNKPIEKQEQEKSKTENNKNKEEHKKNEKEETTHTRKLKELKELLDENIITKEEFEEKKKELLKKI